jgi:hypothetical protein
VSNKVVKQDALENLADALTEDILKTPDDALLREVEEDYGDPRALASKFDQILERAEKQVFGTARSAASPQVRSSLVDLPYRLLEWSSTLFGGGPGRSRAQFQFFSVNRMVWAGVAAVLIVLILAPPVFRSMSEFDERTRQLPALEKEQLARSEQLAAQEKGSLARSEQLAAREKKPTGTPIVQTGDNRSYCKSDGRLALFLVDITTPYDQTDKDLIVKATDKILASLAGGEKVIIRTITDSVTGSEQLVERCIPSCAAEGLDLLFVASCNDSRIRTDRERVYEDIVGALRQRLSKFEERRHSDIVRTVLLAAKEDAVNGRKLSLYIYSDLIENSDYLSGRKFFSTSVPQLIAMLQKDKLIPSLKDADVHVAGVSRGATKDRRPLTVAEQRKVTDFWNAYFKLSGAESIAIGQNILEPSR